MHHWKHEPPKRIITLTGNYGLIWGAVLVSTFVGAVVIVPVKRAR